MPHVQTVQKTVEIPQIEPPGSVSQHTVRFFDGIRGISEYDMIFVWNLSKVFRTVGFQDPCGPASRYVDKVVPIPVAKQVQVPMVNTVSGNLTISEFDLAPDFSTAFGVYQLVVNSYSISSCRGRGSFISNLFRVFHQTEVQRCKGQLKCHRLSTLLLGSTWNGRWRSLPCGITTKPPQTT